MRSVVMCDVDVCTLVKRGMKCHCLSSATKFSTVVTVLLQGVGGWPTHTRSPRGKLHTTRWYIPPALVAYRLCVCIGSKRNASMM